MLDKEINDNVIEKVDFSSMTPKEIHEYLLPLEASGKKPALTRLGVVDKVLSIKDSDTIILLINFNGIIVYMFGDEMPTKFQKLPKEELLHRKIKFKPIAVDEDKVIVSSQAIDRYYTEMMNRQKILQGKIVDIKTYESNPYKKMIMIKSKGDVITIPHSELPKPTPENLDYLIGKITGFIITKVDNGIKIGSMRTVHDFHRSQLLTHLENGDSVTVKVESTPDFGAILTYKNDIEVRLRNKDFSRDYTACKEVLQPGDKIKVKLTEISKFSKVIFVEPVHKYYSASELEIEDIEVNAEYDATIVGVSAFGCFARLAPGKDVLCPIGFNQRDPQIGDKVKVLIKVADSETKRLRGKIMGYEEETIDLSAYGLV